jgi:hypothetical protein
LHVHWVLLGMNNTPLIACTKIIQPMVFTKYPNEGIVFFLGFVKVSKNMIWSPNYFWDTWRGVFHVHWVFCFMNLSTICIKCIQIELELGIALIIHFVYNTPIMENTIWTKLAIPLYKGCQIMPLFICLNEQDQAPCNLFILFFPHHCRPLGVYLKGNQVGGCNLVGEVW